MKVPGREVSQSLNNTEHCVSEAHGHGPCMVTDTHTYTHTRKYTYRHTRKIRDVYTDSNIGISADISISVIVIHQHNI